MPTMQISTLREEFPGKKDRELAKIIAEKYFYQVIVRFKHPSSNDYNQFGCCTNNDQVDGYMNNNNCKDPEIIIYPQNKRLNMILNIHTLGILFDIDKINEFVYSGNYFIGAWKVVWRAVEINTMQTWNGTLLFECDTIGNARGCCVALQSMDELLLRQIHKSLSQSIEFQKVADFPMFLENEFARDQSLMEAGAIDHNGNVIGAKAYCSSPALEEVKKEMNL